VGPASGLDVRLKRIGGSSRGVELHHKHVADDERHATAEQQRRGVVLMYSRGR
jgi:hypothetical protein